MKKVIILIGAGMLMLLGVGGSCGVSGVKILKGMAENRPGEFGRWQGVFRWCARGLPFVDNLPEWVGDKTYIVLLQNNTELRPTGGFMGSYIRARFKDGGLVDWTAQDIYEPDGKLAGHVEPPYPVQEAFRQGWWRLRDSNWDPDFASAAATVAWFLEQGGEEKIDGVMAINLELVNSILKILGPVEVVTYGETVTDKNLYNLAQSYAEVDWKPGSTQKRDFLGAVGTAVWERMKNIRPGQAVKLAGLVKAQLDKKQILVWIGEEKLQAEIREWGWDGGLGNYYGDYLYIVETNLGANKANCCINRELRHEVEIGDGELRERIEVEWQNDNPFENPRPPYFWGGDYIDYVRVVVPREARVVSVSVSGEKLRPQTQGDFARPSSLRQERSEEVWVEEERERVRIIGFWAVVPAGERVAAEVKYELPGDEFADMYRVLVKRQPGIEKFAYRLTVNGIVRREGEVMKDERIEAGME
ncbi:MAG: hypothetical protein UX78_C0010G0025 [Candidatus Amesbacteria bacterium GW2011_GWA2_47_11]|uniref:DUF4012 domain-containing protein n=1 Tax=Candidatus Amesbacteria bacterium GW2011_GWA2_47_11 TaxID=1618357 RepID=A0A0G1RGW2_9BACT|nr:MAG: hypothetical protein UX78_C0010G0025 [Candidatus Amesbacteria bacterium GW2011_GWA2_47_11]